MNRGSLRVKFVVLWALLCLLKLVLAWRLPLFVDEAFYAWEGQRLAWAYSDLPGLTAWLTRLGATVAGDSAFALRLPFLLLGVAVPWQVVGLARRTVGAGHAWQAGLLALLMPLSGWLGVMAMPDVPLVFAALLCLDGLLRCRAQPDVAGWIRLAAGLVIGGLSHYRFALVIAAGFAGLLLDPRARALLRRPALWLALALGAAAWLPLLGWNLAHAGAGWRFQMVERNPWAFHADGALWLPIQWLVVTPMLFVLLVRTARGLWRDEAYGDTRRLLAGVAAVAVAGYFALGFFADRERVSFHWPLAGWLVLVVAAPITLAQWRPWARRALVVLAACGLLAAFMFLAGAAWPSARAALADSRAYPAGFAGWDAIAQRLRADPPPPGTRLVADNFELAAQLTHALGRADVRVLDHALNHKHGRAAQLALWRALYAPRGRDAGVPAWLVVEDSATPMKARLDYYHALCAQLGPLPPPDVLDVDGGRKRFLIFRLAVPATAMAATCVAPALAWIDAPARNAHVGDAIAVSGWAFKDGAGLAKVTVTLDGRPVAEARYGRAMADVAAFWRISTDPAQPRVGFDANVDLAGVAPGRHALGLVLYGRDGSVEPWPSQPIVVAR